MATTYMGLTNPIPGTTGGIGNAPAGQDYASDISGDLIIIDAHNHITVGQQIQTAALDLNADVNLQSNNIDNLRSLRMISNATNISAVGDIGCIYNVAGNLWYNNGSGSEIQLTNGSTISTPTITLSNYIYQLVVSNFAISPAANANYFAINTASQITMTLPKSVSVASGTYYTFKDIASIAATNNIIINVNGSSSDLIDGASSYTISTNLGSVVLVADGSANWYVLNDDAISLHHNPVSTIAPTAGQLLIENASAGGSQWTTLSGDVSLSVSTIGQATVLKLQGSPVSSVAPSTNNTLVWTGSLWTPTGMPLSGDISGTSAAATVAALQGNAVANTAPTNGYVLTWNSTAAQWQPQAITSGAVTLSGDVSGAASSNTANKIQGNLVAAGNLSKGQFLVATGTNTWAATTISGDLSASATTPGSTTVVALQGVAINPVAPTSGYVLTYTTGTGWAPLANTAGSVSLSGDVTGSTASNTVAAIQGNAVKSGALVKGQFLVATGVANWTAASLSGDAIATGPGIIQNVGIQGNYVATGALSVGQFLIATGTSLWAPTKLTGDVSASTTTGGYLSVNALRNNTVATGALTKGQFLVATGTANWQNTTLSGDVSASAVTPGLLTNVGIQGNTFTSGAPTKGQLVAATTTSNYGPVTVSGDIVASTSTPGKFNVSSLTGSLGTVDIATTGNILTWNSATTSPGLHQGITSSANGAQMTIEAQTSTDGNGGNLVLLGGSGSAAQGIIGFGSGGTTLASIGQYGLSTTTLDVGITTGTVTLTAAQYAYMNLTLTGSLTGNVTMVFPAVNGLWVVDGSQLTLNGHAVVFKSGSYTTSVGISGTNQLLLVATTAFNMINVFLGSD